MIITCSIGALLQVDINTCHNSCYFLNIYIHQALEDLSK